MAKKNGSSNNNYSIDIWKQTAPSSFVSKTFDNNTGPWKFYDDSSDTSSSSSSTRTSNSGSTKTSTKSGNGNGNRSDTSTTSTTEQPNANEQNSQQGSQQGGQQQPPKRDTSAWDNPEGIMEYWGSPPEKDEKSDKYKKVYVDKSNITGEGSPNVVKIGETDNLLKENLNQNDDLFLKICLPAYGVDDFINERSLWQKGTYNTLGEQGWFYFKIFFDFHDSKLFAGLLDIYNNQTFLLNTSALRYLYGIRKYYMHERIHERIIALAKFTSLLSYINCACPWFFKSISNISKLNGLNNTEMSKEKSITIQCDADAIDMKLNTLFDLYKYACYDDIYKKEIIPENLRKFDMQIIIMNVPLKYFHSAFLYTNPSTHINQLANLAGTLKGPLSKISSFISGQDIQYHDFKSLKNSVNPNDKDLMSFQLFTLKNCEFVINESLEGYYSNALSNENFFNLGNNTIKIKYDNVYKHSYNEWEYLFFGSTLISDGNSFSEQNLCQNQFLNKIYTESAAINNDDSILKTKYKNRINSIKDNINNIFYTPSQNGIYKSLIDFSEKTIKDAMIGITNPYYLGNIGDPNVITLNSTLRKYARLYGNIDRYSDNEISKFINKWTNKGLDILNHGTNNLNEYYNNHMKKTVLGKTIDYGKKHF